jgi:hypothetical protein
MKTDNQHPKTATYLFLLAIQRFGAITFVWRGITRIQAGSGQSGGATSKRRVFRSCDRRCFIRHANLVLVPSAANSNPVSAFEPIPESPASLSGPRLSFIFGSALFSVVIFRHLPELGRETDLLLMGQRGLIFVGCLFALFCTSLEVERLVQAFESNRN